MPLKMLCALQFGHSNWCSFPIIYALNLNTYLIVSTDGQLGRTQNHLGTRPLDISVGVLITLIKMRRSSHRGCHHSCAGILGYVNQEESWAWIHLSLLPNCAFILLKRRYNNRNPWSSRKSISRRCMFSTHHYLSKQKGRSVWFTVRHSVIVSSYSEA